MIYKNLLSEIKDCSTLLDMGSGHGRYSETAHNMGFKVTAFDVRGVRFPDYLKEVINYEISDVRFWTNYDFDIIVYSGLLYHLDLETQREVFKRIGKSKAKYMIINTHFCPEENYEYWKLTDFVNTKDHAGALYFEGKEKTPLSSFGNDYSFWHTEDSLISWVKKYAKMSCEKIEPKVMECRRFYLCKR